MATDNGHNGNPPRRRGNVLVLAILMTMLLFILGIAFLSTTMIEKSTVTSLGSEEYLDSGVQIVVERINEVLVDDLFQGSDYDAAVLNDHRKLYDYPDENNRWLASQEPEYDDGTFSGYPPHYFWRHITDLWGSFNDPQTPGPGNPEVRWYDPDEKDDTTGPMGPYDLQVRQDGPAGDLFKVSAYHVPIRIVAEDEPINVFISGSHGPELDRIDPRPSGWPVNPVPDTYKVNGMRADADGDGVVDSRWVRLGRQGPQGEYLWAAVRIVDNGGKININTAFRNPEHSLPEGADPGVNPRRWDGSRLSHVDLIGIRANGDAGIPVTVMEGYRYVNGTIAFNPEDYLFDTQYEMDVARRILNPLSLGVGLEYQTFGMTDELDLANRYLLLSPMTAVGSFPSRLWPVTFNPPTGTVGKQYPYTQDIASNPSSFDIASSRPLNIWYDKVTPDWDVPGNYNRRHLFTTYSFDRILRRADVDALGSVTRCEDLPGQRKVALLLADEGSGIGNGQYSGFADAAGRDKYWEYLAGALYRSLPADNTNLIQARFGDDANFGYNREKLARCWALNLIDLQDTYLSGEPPVNQDRPTVQKADDTTYYGLESLDIVRKHTLFISKLGYCEIDPCQPGMYPKGKYYAIELFNPDGTPSTTKDLGDYEIRVMDGSDNLKFTLDLGSLVVQDSDPTSPSGSPTSFEKDTAVVAFYNSSAHDVFEDTAESANYPDAETSTENAFNTWLTTGSNVDFPEPSDYLSEMLDDDYKIVLVNTELDDMPVDCVVVPSTLTGGTGPTVLYRRYVIPGTSLLLPDAPAHSGLVSSYPWEKAASPVDPDRLGDDIDPRDKGAGGDLIAVTDSTNSTVQQDFAGFRIKLAETSEPLATVGQAAGAPVVGYWYFEDGSTHRCMTVWQGLVESLVMIKKLNGTPDLLADQDRGIELGSYGRIRLDDPAFMNWNLPTAPFTQKANVFDLVSYFDPSGDLEAGSTTPVDNDGNPWTSNDPADDDFDQDEDDVDLPVYLGGGVPGDVDADETLPRWYEQAVPGRININTAPWYVIAQLPWMQEPSLPAYHADRYKLARAIVAYRDKTTLVADGVDYFWAGSVNSRKVGMGLPVAAPDVREDRGFVSVHELLNVTQDPFLANYDPWYDIRRYGRDTFNSSPVNNNPVGSGDPGPFYNEDDVANDVTERDILFQRISNLVTVRSDVFTAYILVRIGQTGPQKRMIAVFDRSTVFNRGDVPRLVALHPVPDPQ